MTTEDLLHVTCFAVRTPEAADAQGRGGWDIQCGPLPFADIILMYKEENPAIQLREIASKVVSRDISDEEDAEMRKQFIEKAKDIGWEWDEAARGWTAPCLQ